MCCFVTIQGSHTQNSHADPIECYTQTSQKALACILYRHELLDRKQQVLAGKLQFSSESQQRNHMSTWVPKVLSLLPWPLYR